MNTHKYNTPDCPQFWSLPSLLSAHQLPEINQQSLISTESFFFHFHFLLYTPHHTHHWPRLTDLSLLSALSLISCHSRFSFFPPFSFKTL